MQRTSSESATSRAPEVGRRSGAGGGERALTLPIHSFSLCARFFDLACSWPPARSELIDFRKTYHQLLVFALYFTRVTRRCRAPQLFTASDLITDSRRHRRELSRLLTLGAVN